MNGKKNAIKRHRILIIFFMLFTTFSNMPISVVQATDEGVVTSIELSSSQISIKPGSSTQIKALVKDQNGNEIQDQTVTWSSGDTKIATVDNTGMVYVKKEIYSFGEIETKTIDNTGMITGKNIGTAIITVECNGKTATCEVKVQEEESAVTSTATNAATGTAISSEFTQIRAFLINWLLSSKIM